MSECTNPSLHEPVVDERNSVEPDYHPNFDGPAEPVGLLSVRQVILSELRAKHAIHMMKCHQFERAIDLLSDNQVTDEMAGMVAGNILRANIGP